MKLAILLALAVSAFGQQLTSVASKLAVRPGESGTITLSLANQPTPPAISALQFTDIATGLVITLPIPGGVASDKTIACGSTANRICILYALTPQAIPNGQILTVGFTAPTNAAPGVATYKISGVIAATGIGDATPLTGPGDLTFTILSPFDLTGDGKVDASDVNRVVSQVIGNTAVTDCDVNRDSLCNVRDVKAVAAAIP